jgi:hypothetical protein
MLISRRTALISGAAAMGFIGGRGTLRAESEASFDQPLYPKFPRTTLARIRSVKTSTIRGSGWASISDVTIDANAPAEDKPYGESEVQLTMSGANSVASYYSGASAVAPVDVRKGNIVISIRNVANMKAVRSNYTVSVALCSAGSPASPASNCHKVSIQRIFGEKAQNASFRQEISIPINRFSPAGSGADLGAITYALVTWKRVAGPAVTFCAGDIDFQPNPRIDDLTPIILRFDGGYISQYTYGYRQLTAAFGGAAPALLHDPLYFIGSGHKQVMDWADVADWVAHGAEFAPHNGTSSSKLAGEAAYASEHQGARLGAKAKGYDHSGSTGAYYSKVDLGTKDFVYAVMRNRIYRMLLNYTTGDNTATPMAFGSETFPPGDRWNVRCMNGDSWFKGGADKHVTDWMNSVRDNRGLGIIVFHAGLAKPGPGRLTFDTLIANVLAGPDKFTLTTPCALFDPYVAQYGGV